MFSIVIPLYNKEKYVAQTLESVFKQSFQEFEIIIVDDGSTDKSIEEVEKFDDTRIRIFRQENAGVSAARNRGIKESKYDFIAFLDADDAWLPNYLMTIDLLINKYSECSVFATQYIIKSQTSSQPIDTKGLSFDIDGIIDNYFYIASINMPPLWTSATVVKKEAMDNIKGFPKGIKSGEDLLTWARLAANYDIAYSIEPKAIFVRGEDNPLERRSLDLHDQVGDSLKQLLNTGNPEKINSLKKYIAYWYKIRVSLFLRFGKQKEAALELQKMIKFTNKNINYYILAFIIYSPAMLSRLLYQLFNHLKIKIRKVKFLLNGKNS